MIDNPRRIRKSIFVLFFEAVSQYLADGPPRRNACRLHVLKRWPWPQSIQYPDRVLNGLPDGKVVSRGLQLLRADQERNALYPRSGPATVPLIDHTHQAGLRLCTAVSAPPPLAATDSATTRAQRAIPPSSAPVDPEHTPDSQAPQLLPKTSPERHHFAPRSNIHRNSPQLPAPAARTPGGHQRFSHLPRHLNPEPLLLYRRRRIQKRPYHSIEFRIVRPPHQVAAPDPARIPTAPLAKCISNIAALSKATTPINPAAFLGLLRTAPVGCIEHDPRLRLSTEPSSCAPRSAQSPPAPPAIRPPPARSNTPRCRGARPLHHGLVIRACQNNADPARENYLLQLQFSSCCTCDIGAGPCLIHRLVICAALPAPHIRSPTSAP